MDTAVIKKVMLIVFWDMKNPLLSISSKMVQLYTVLPIANFIEWALYINTHTHTHTHTQVFVYKYKDVRISTEFYTSFLAEFPLYKIQFTWLIFITELIALTRKEIGKWISIVENKCFRLDFRFSVYIYKDGCCSYKERIRIDFKIRRSTKRFVFFFKFIYCFIF